MQLPFFLIPQVRINAFQTLFVLFFFISNLFPFFLVNGVEMDSEFCLYSSSRPHGEATQSEGGSRRNQERGASEGGGRLFL